MPQTKSTAEAFETWRLISSESKQWTKYLTQCNLNSPLKTEARRELEPKCGKGKWCWLTSAESFAATNRSVFLNLMKFTFTFYTNCVYFYLIIIGTVTSPNNCSELQCNWLLPANSLCASVYAIKACRFRRLLCNRKLNAELRANTITKMNKVQLVKVVTRLTYKGSGRTMPHY